MSKKTKKATIKTPVKDLRKGETIQQHNTRLLKEINAGLNLIIKKMEEIRKGATKEAAAC